jgi:hypothetical protein
MVIVVVVTVMMVIGIMIKDNYLVKPKHLHSSHKVPIK